jgi:hypothetical protein
MQSTLITQDKIDWDKPQLLISSVGDVVLSTSVQLNEKVFSGTIVYQKSNDKNSTIGTYSNNWWRNSFRLLAKNEIIQLQND